MKYEKTQKGNPNKLTIHQHVFPERSIKRYCDKNGCINVYLIQQEKVITNTKPNNDLFCARRTWDHNTENKFMRRKESDFQKIADNILDNNSKKLSPFNSSDNNIISTFYVLCRLRSEVKANPYPDARSSAIPGTVASKDKEEILEKNGYMFSKGNVIPSRFINGINIQILLERLIPENTSWGLIQSNEIEFIVPDSFGNIGIVPLSPHHCLAANHTGGIITAKNATEINETAINCSTEYYFAKNFSKCGITTPKT